MTTTIPSRREEETAGHLDPFPMNGVANSHFIKAILRRWYIVLVGIGLTALAILNTSSSPIVYTTRIEIVFLAPSDWGTGNSLQNSTDALIFFAAAVQRIVTQGTPQLQSVSADATLYGAGITDGSAVSLIDTGGQWTTSISRPVIAVEVVKPSKAEVLSTATELVAQVTKVANDLQTTTNAPPTDWVRVQTTPAEISVVGIKGSRIRAAGGIAILGAILTFGACVITDTHSRNRRARKAWARSTEPELPDAHQVKAQAQ